MDVGLREARYPGRPFWAPWKVTLTFCFLLSASWMLSLNSELWQVAEVQLRQSTMVLPALVGKGDKEDLF